MRIVMHTRSGELELLSWRAAPLAFLLALAVLGAPALIAFAAAHSCSPARAVPRADVPLRALQAASIPVPHSTWLAQCTAFPVDAVDGITVVRVRARPGRVTALLRQGKRRGWLQAHRAGVLNGKAVWAVRGPTALMAAMAASPSCSGSNGRVVAWGAVKDLPPVILAQVAQWFTCCGSATIGGEVKRAWPCAWQLAASPQFRPGLAVDRLDGYGPGVVGQRGACADYQTEEIP